MVKMNIGQIEFQLKEFHDFSFLKEYGEVFKVFDEQDSGNICFGVIKNGNKLFLKYAGANTINFNGEISQAVECLRSSVSIYEDLSHPNLVRLVKHQRVNDGYLLVFNWCDGANLSYKSKQEPKPIDLFKALPMDKKLKAIESIFEFHRFVAMKGYVAIDLYDACFLYDFDKDFLTICDIDMYRKTPYINMLGRMWGSSRFMSKEEFTLNGVIDEVSNVFNMGAVAFELLGSNKDRTINSWNAKIELFEVAKKATNEDKNDRYQSINEFISAWNKAKD